MTKLNKIAIIDADLIGRKRHNFPNLVCMKISGYHKSLGDSVVLKRDYDGLQNFDKVYIAKVFTDTRCPEHVLKLPNVTYGGTGFYFDKAPMLPSIIEHHMPDYDLYADYVAECASIGKKISDTYTDYSIGYLTRGCFRKCEFCVNQKYDRAFKNSSLAEFLDTNKKKICLLDDNFLSHPDWREMLLELKATGKRFVFKQGLDERLLTPEKCEMLFEGNYDGDVVFAFDNLDDYDLIEQKLKMLGKYRNGKRIKFYVLCAFDRSGCYNEDFWLQDIESIFKRVDLLAKHKATPYLMRYEKYNNSPVRGMYITLARWINQPQFYKKMSFGEFIQANGEKSASRRYLIDFLDKFNGFDCTWLNWKCENRSKKNDEIRKSF